jgi:hypothetical protein
MSILVWSHKKCFFHFRSAEIGFFFVKQLPKREIERSEQHPTLIVDHLGTHISSRFVAAAFGGIF